MFKITDRIEFDSKGRAVCPSCQQVKGPGYNAKNLSLVPGTEGAYKCHRGCTPEAIRSALGEPKGADRQIPTALAKPAPPPKLLTPQQVRKATDKLLTGEKALQWLSDRGVNNALIQQHRIGIYQYANQWCIGIPYPVDDTHYLIKYYLNWQTRYETRQPGITKRLWFSYLPEGATETWLCEGEWDAIVLGDLVQRQGLKIAIATGSGGAGTVPDELDLLPGKVTIFYDRDEPGQQGAIAVALALGDRAGIAQVPMPDGCDIKGYDVRDAIGRGYTLDDFLRAAGVAAPPEVAIEFNPLREKLITTQQLIDRAPDYVEFLVHDLITANELQVLAAPPRAGKSLAALGLAHSVATGSEFMGRPTQQGSVIYVNVEDSEAKLKERVTAQQWAGDVPVYWLTDFSLSEWMNLVKLIYELRPRLVVIDTLTSVRDDDTDENSSKLKKVIDPLKQAAKVFNCAIVLVHHTKKLSAQSLEDIDVFDTMRGSGIIRSECRGALVMAEIKNQNTGRNEWRLIAENGSYQKQDLAIVLDANTLTWKTITNWTPNISLSQEDQALTYLDKVGSASIQQVAQNTSIPVKSAYTVLTRLVQRGMLIKQGTRANAAYSRPIQQIQQLNSLLNPQNVEPVKAEGPDSTKNTFFISTEHSVQNSALAVSENSSCPIFVESEGLMHSQQALQQFNTNSTTGDFVESEPQNTTLSMSKEVDVEFKKVLLNSTTIKVGDRVEILTGRQVGKICTIVSFLEEGLVEVHHPKWAIARHYKPEHLKLVEDSDPD